jgi:membrane-bound lytic murein transglycosylase D
LRREAETLYQAGRRDEARALVRQAAESIAAAAPDGDAKQDDPFLRAYLRDLSATLVAWAEPAAPPPLRNQAPAISSNDFAHPRINAFLNYWTAPKQQVRLALGRQRLAFYRPAMARIFRDEGVPEWLLAVGFVESTYSTTARSPKQAVGIWQFIPSTGAGFGLQRTAWTDERQDVAKSTRAAARYLRQLYALFDDWPLALAAYNWGEGRVARLIQRTGVRDYWTLAAQGLMPTETANYVPSIYAAARLLGLDPQAPAVAQTETKTLRRKN